MQLSTAGKWGRVAAAALAGATQGFAAGQGPSGPARAAVAGLQAGMQIGQGNQDQTLALADRMNKQDRDRQLFNANMALLDQRIVAAKNENQRSGVIFSNQVRDSNLNFAKNMRDMGAELRGTFTDDAGLAAAVSDPNNVQAHIGSNGLMMPNYTFNPDGTVRGVEMWVLPEDRRNQLNSTPVDIQRVKLDPDHPGRLIADTPLHIEPYTMSNQDIVAAIKTQHDLGNTLTNQAWTAGTAARRADLEAQKVPSQIALQRAEATHAIAQADLARSQIEALNPIDTLISRAGGGGGGTAAGGTAASPQAQFEALGSTAPRTNPDGTPAPSEAGARLLAAMDPSTAALVQRYGEYRGDAAELGRSKNREQFARLVAMVYPQWDRAKYMERQKTMTSLAPGGPLYNTQSALNLAIRHLGTMANAMRVVDPGEFSPENAAEQVFRNIGIASRRTKDAQGTYNVAASGVATELNKAFANTGQTHQTETDQWRSNVDINKPRSMQEGTIRGALDMLASRMDIAQEMYAQGMGTPQAKMNMLNPESIQTLHNIPGGDDILRRYGYPVPTTGANAAAAARAPAAAPAPQAPAARVVPPGAHAGRDANGNIVGYQDAQGWHSF
jgi:hypothetical protein